MADIPRWAPGVDYLGGTFVQDEDGNIFITPVDHRSTIQNGPVAGEVPDGPTVGVDRAAVVEIVREMFVGHTPERETGIRLTYEPLTGRVTITATRNISFTDFSNAIQSQLEGRPAGQYWLTINKDRTRS